MSRLLYEEPYRLYLRNKYPIILSFFLAFALISYLFAESIRCQFLDPSCVSHGGVVELAIYVACIIALGFIWLVDLGLARKRVRIYEDKIVPALPRRFFSSFKVLWYGDIIRKDDIQTARLEVLSRDGEEFKTKERLLETHGNAGDWRLELVFKDGERYLMNWRRLLPRDETLKKRGTEAMRIFLGGVPEKDS